MANFSWKKTNAPKATRYDDIWFIDEKKGWTVNSNGQILHTEDGGKNWTIQFTVPSSDKVWLRCISFSDENNGWVGTVTATDRLFRTSDGGKSWVKVKNLPPQPTAICGLCLVEKDIIYMAGTNYPNRPVAVIKSPDSGKNWEKIDMSSHADLLVDIYFENENRGWVVGGKGGSTRNKIKPVVLYTEDGGKSWIDQLDGMANSFPFGEWGWKIQFLNSSLGFVSLENFTEGAILKTTNGGKKWERFKVDDPQKNANLEGIGFLNQKTGWVGGWGDKQFKGGYSSKTEDGGNSWADANHIGKFINRFRFIGKPLKAAYASGDTIYKYSPVEEKFTKSNDIVPSLISNIDAEAYFDKFELKVNVPKKSKMLEIDIWDRFGQHLSTIADVKNPQEGPNKYSWNFPKNKLEYTPDVEHFIYRVTIDDKVESKLVRKVNSNSGDLIVETLEKRLLASENQNDPPPFPSVEEEKEALHRMANIEDFPEFRIIAKKLAEIYLANADYNAVALYNEFHYTPEDFDKRMKEIYESYLPDMYKPHRYDRDIVEWRNVKGEIKKYKIGRASNKVVKDRLLQLAPFNLMDGVWLQNMMQARPSDEVQSRLFEIWADEVGNGSTRENHANVYQDLLRSQGYYLPEVTSREFLNLDIADGAWRSPVFQMCVGLFPQHFFPELLGMTLFLEWEATPTLTPTVNMMGGRGINPLFYSLHVAIDNISEGHGALAKEAVEIYLEEKREEGGDIAVQQSWKRIWNGYVGWATAGFSGVGLPERRLIIDKKSINIGTLEEPICYPNWKEYYHNKMVSMIEAKAGPAGQVHGNATLEGKLLNELFDHPEELMNKLISSGWLNIESPRQSKFFKLIEFEGPMYKVFTHEDKEIILDWLESLSKENTGCINPLPDNSNPGNLLKQVIQIVQDFSGIARRAHGSLTLPNESGEPISFVSYLDNPISLLKAMIRGGWIIPGNSNRSIFISRILKNQGPMEGVFDEDMVETFIKWIDEGAKFEDSDIDSIESFVDKNEMVEPKFELAMLRPFIGQGAVH